MTANTMSTEDSRAVINRMYSAAITGNMEEFSATIDDDAQFHEPDCLPYGGSFRGKKALFDLFLRVGKYLNYSTIKLGYVLAEGEKVVTAISLLATNGNEIRLLEEAKVRNGKVVDLRIYLFDPLKVMNK